MANIGVKINMKETVGIITEKIMVIIRVKIMAIIVNVV